MPLTAKRWRALRESGVRVCCPSRLFFAAKGGQAASRHRAPPASMTCGTAKFLSAARRAAAAALASSPDVAQVLMTESDARTSLTPLIIKPCKTFQVSEYKNLRSRPLPNPSSRTKQTKQPKKLPESQSRHNKARSYISAPHHSSSLTLHNTTTTQTNKLPNYQNELHLSPH